MRVRERRITVPSFGNFRRNGVDRASNLQLQLPLMFLMFLMFAVVRNGEEDCERFPDGGHNIKTTTSPVNNAARGTDACAESVAAGAASVEFATGTL
jgi:hypothetical protein